VDTQSAAPGTIIEVSAEDIAQMARDRWPYLSAVGISEAGAANGRECAMYALGWTWAQQQGVGTGVRVQVPEEFLAAVSCAFVLNGFSLELVSTWTEPPGANEQPRRLRTLDIWRDARA
jgi:hypothetical protein